MYLSKSHNIIVKETNFALTFILKIYHYTKSEINMQWIERVNLPIPNDFLSQRPSQTHVRSWRLKSVIDFKRGGMTSIAVIPCPGAQTAN